MVYEGPEVGQSRSCASWVICIWMFSVFRLSKHLDHVLKEPNLDRICGLLSHSR